MPINYVFKDSKASDTVAKILMFVSKFSKKQALVKFGDSSVSVIWGGSPKTYYIHAEATHLDMFQHKIQRRHFGIDHCTVVQVDPTLLGRTLRGSGGDKCIKLSIIRPNRIQVVVDYIDNATRTITHTIPCDMKTRDDYDLMLIEKIEYRLCRYNTRSYVDTISRFKLIIDSFVRLGTPRVYIQSKQASGSTNNLKINAKNEGSIVDVLLTDLVDGHDELIVKEEYDESDYPMNQPRRSDAGVQIDTKKLSLFISGLPKKSRVCFDIEHNKCLKITLNNEVSQGEKIHQSLLLLHSLNN